MNALRRTYVLSSGASFHSSNVEHSPFDELSEAGEDIRQQTGRRLELNLRLTDTKPERRDLDHCPVSLLCKSGVLPGRSYDGPLRFKSGSVSDES
jgi:hypothetical protein